MNSPALPLDDELERIAASGFEFADLTLEPPGGWPVDPERVAARLAELGLGGVGHTAYYLPIASPFDAVRAGALRSFVDALDAFAAIGVGVVNVHPDPMTRLFPRPEIRRRNAEAIAMLLEVASARGLTLAVENLGPRFGTLDDLAAVLDAVPDAAFHLDVGHAHLVRPGAVTEFVHELLNAFGDRLAHVHVSDNFGLEDLHLPLGTGTIDWPAVVRELKDTGWDGTVTIEVFSHERAHLETSRRLWQQWWDAAQVEASTRSASNS